MSSSGHKSKIKSGLASGIAAFLALLVMSLNIGGLDHFFPIIANFGLLFFAASMVSLVIGLFLYRYSLVWSLISGAAIGLICGFLIVVSIASEI
jgi:hypothetical protein